MATFVHSAVLLMGVGNPSYYLLGHPSLPGRALYPPLLPTHCLIIEMDKQPHTTIDSELFSRCWKVQIKMSIQMLLFFHVYVRGREERLAALDVMEQTVTEKQMEHEIKF